ncbi:MAG: PfkB family carbohydrate kinase, partial [Bilophila sp.]
MSLLSSRDNIHAEGRAKSPVSAQARMQQVIAALPEMVDRLTGTRVLVVGDLMLDAYLLGDAERISPEAPVPVVRVESERYLLGGAGNVARNIAALGGKATLIGTVGEDPPAANIRSLLHNEGITAALVPLADRPTTVKTRIMARRQQMLRLDYENTAQLAEADLERVFEVIASELVEHELLILSDYSKGLVSAAFMRRLAEVIAGCPHPVKVLVDPKPSNVLLYAGAFLLTPNTKETGECAGLPVRNQAEILAAGRKIFAEVGCAHLLTTLGSEGMALFLDRDDVWHLPTMARDVFDVTGAGDTVIATLGLALAAGVDLLASCVLANYAAGL